MNKWEALFAQRLEIEKRERKVIEWKFEAVKLRLADRTFYTPDFMVVLADLRLAFYEVKGHLRDDAAVKFKVAAETFPQFTWTMFRYKGGTWEAIYSF